jgi:hypothetical protein
MVFADCFEESRTPFFPPQSSKMGKERNTFTFVTEMQKTFNHFP